MLHIPSDSWRGWLAGATLATLMAPAHALNVFVCEPEWGAVVRALAPDAQVRSATHARQDPHHIEARPSLIAALRRADLAVCTGASLESGWLPVLQQRSANPRVQTGAPGMVFAADHAALIDPRPPGSPFDGDVHTEGNPHLHLDPRRMLEVAGAVREAIEQTEPARREQLRSRQAAWEKDWRGRIAQWERRAAPLRGMRIAAQHTSYAYLWNWLGIEQVADLEPKPGMPPTPGHLQRVLALASAAPPRAVIVSTYQDPKPGQWLGQQLRIPVLQLPATVSEEAPASELATFFDQLIDRLLEVHGSR
ncbi:MAG: zinc ABC transporter substrate-binding protein [Comamonadaceae bacterium]|nr:MAG: zinc ABC transporter substrate-binding protein [Comamonadaceae bacterium]